MDDRGLPTTPEERAEARDLTARIAAQDREAGTVRAICPGSLPALRAAAANPPQPEGPTA